jgi:N-glycosylase/DNA lyase
MDYSSYEKFDGGIKLTEVKNFELAHIFDCGQCFRWNMQKNGNYIGVAFGRVIEVEKAYDEVLIHNTTEEDFKTIWESYFDLKRDYEPIKESLSKDELLKNAVEFGNGIRLLQQEPFEITLSFIISANNRIPMIKRAIENISRAFGEPIIYKDVTYYSFPSLEKLSIVTLEEMATCGLGFRDKYVMDTVKKISDYKKNGDGDNTNEVEEIIYDLDYIKALSDDECHESLQAFSGIGPKVADCIMLFSMQKYSAFPVDIWVKRAMQHFYLAPDVSLKKIREFGRDKFGNLSGFAQQYLFYYARENNIKVD